MGKTEVWVDGPMHPDLFDGETPIRVKKKLEKRPQEDDISRVETDEQPAPECTSTPS